MHFAVLLDLDKFDSFVRLHSRVLGSIVVSIPACHAGDRGSIPRRGGYFFLIFDTTSLCSVHQLAFGDIYDIYLQNVQQGTELY